MCILAGIDRGLLPFFKRVLRSVGARWTVTVVPLDVVRLGRLAPQLIICDVDAIDVDPLEFMRRTRFVLPDCLIAVYTYRVEQPWGFACHLAGVNCVLSKNSDQTLLADGIRQALVSGCYTDPGFAAA